MPRTSPPTPNRLRSGLALALILLVLGLVSVATAGVASAHTHLVKISPALGATLTAPPSAVMLTFSEPVATGFATVRVTDGNGRDVAAGPAQVAGAVVTQPLRADLASGPYAVAFRVVSSDGHPVADVSAFTLALRGWVQPTPSPSTPITSGAPSGASSGTDPHAASHPGSPASADPATTRLRRLALAVGVGALALAIGTTMVALSRRTTAS